MNFNPLLSQIFRHTWALRPQDAINYGPVVASIISGNLESPEEKEPLGAYVFHSSGLKRMMDEETDGEKSVLDSAPPGSIVFVPLKGVMHKEDSMSHYGTESIAELIKEAAAHENVSSIILEIDSGGGSVDSVAPMLMLLNSLKSMFLLLLWLIYVLQQLCGLLLPAV